MIRLLVGTVLLTLATAPVLACEFQKSTSTDTQRRTVASQPANSHSISPQSTRVDRKPS